MVRAVLEASTDDATESVSHTEWLEEASDDELTAIYDEYSSRFTHLVGELASSRGYPHKTLAADKAWFESWYPEAFAAAAWRHGDGWLCLAAEHADRETPVILQVRRVTDARLEALAGDSK